MKPSTFFRLVKILACAWAAAGRAAEPAPLRVSDDGRGLVDAAGKPVFLLADTAWSLAIRPSREDAEYYLRRRAAQGFNAVTFVLFAPGRNELSDRTVNAYGDAPFALRDGRPDPTRPLVTAGASFDDPEQYDYWDHVDYLVALTRRLGFRAILLPTWGSGVVGSYDAKNAADIVFNAGSARDYATWLARRYGAEPHVIWMLGGDRAAVNGEKDFRPVFRALGEALHAGAPRQLISYHPRKSAPQSSAWFHDDPWFAFNSIQEWPDQQMRCIAGDWAKSPPKPTWLFEGRYEGYWKNNYKAEDWGDWQVRQQAYQTVFSGAFGTTYGHERVFGFGFDGVDWKQHLDAPGARSLTHLAALMRRFSSAELATRVPEQALLAGDPGKPQRVRSDAIVATTAHARTKTMIYSASGRPIRVKSSELRGEQFAYWFNPRRGTWHRDGVESAEPLSFARLSATRDPAAVQEFVPPTHGDGEDWVLVLATTPMFQ